MDLSDELRIEHLVNHLEEFLKVKTQKMFKKDHKDEEYQKRMVEAAEKAREDRRLKDKVKIKK